VTIINETLDQTCLEIYDKNTAGSFPIINKVINMWPTRNLGLSLTYLRIATSKNSVHLTNKQSTLSNTTIQYRTTKCYTFRSLRTNIMHCLLRQYKTYVCA